DHPLDLPGAALITGGLGLVTYALTAAGEHGGLANPGLLALGAALIAAFILWQARIANPMVPLGLFRDRGFAGANIATALIYLALSAILFFLPMTLIAGWGLAEIWASAAFAPLSILIPVLSAPAGRLADRYGAGPLIGLGAACVAVSFAALAAVVPVGPTALWWGVLPATALMGFGMGLVVAPLSTAIMTSVPTDRSGVASGINNAVSRVAGLIAVAALGSVAGGVYAVAGGTESFGALSDAAGHAEAMRRGFQAVAVITAALTAIGAVTAWVLIPRRVPLDR
ncbi:MAG: MFS transporter, partial [Pseudomonadota bacterium]